MKKSKKQRGEPFAMHVTRSVGLLNTVAIGSFTYRLVGLYALFIFGAFILFIKSELFYLNIMAMVGYIAFMSIVISDTPTGRPMFSNFYGTIFKKPIRMVVSDLSTTTTIGHGVKEVIMRDDLNVPMFKLINGHYAFVYHVTSGINHWSDDYDVDLQALYMKNLFNILEAEEGLYVVTKADNDTGMLSLANMLDDVESFDGDDLKQLSDRRKFLLNKVGSDSVGVSVQQYVILEIKQNNIERVYRALDKASLILRPAPYPMDILLSAMGFEGGTIINEK